MLVSAMALGGFRAGRSQLALLSKAGLCEAGLLIRVCCHLWGGGCCFMGSPRCTGLPG